MLTVFDPRLDKCYPNPWIGAAFIGTPPNGRTRRVAGIRQLEAMSLQALAGFDTIIDVRSPGEFALDHIPGAINLPVLNDSERAEVGAIYVQESRLRANRIGAAYVARNIAAHLEGPLSAKPADFAPLIYCWRGGQRSAAMATILSRVGWRTTLVSGGYKAYRLAVRQALYDVACPLRFLLLDGDTGCGKTQILARLATQGHQVLDLEGLAVHRGSLLGQWPDRPQPSQKLFESQLWSVLDHLDPSRPVVVEAESSKIGELMVPPSLWQAMQAAPRIELTAPRAARAAHLLTTYPDIVADQARLETLLARLPVHIGKSHLDAWRELARAREFLQLAEEIMAEHYDPAYARWRRRDGRPALATIAMDGLDPQHQIAASAAVAEVIAAQTP